MEQQEITIGQVTYELSRVFQGARDPAQLIVERLAQNIPAGQYVDGENGHGV